jgi:hypothetical protein
MHVCKYRDECVYMRAFMHALQDFLALQVSVNSRLAYSDFYPGQLGSISLSGLTGDLGLMETESFICIRDCHDW